MISRLEIPAFAMMFPDSTKNGIARSRNLLIPEYMLVATIVRVCTGVEDCAYGGKSEADSDGYTQDQEYEEGDK